MSTIKNFIDKISEESINLLSSVNISLPDLLGYLIILFIIAYVVQFRVKFNEITESNDGKQEIIETKLNIPRELRNSVIITDLPIIPYSWWNIFKLD
jgi:hypothetical protein